MIAKLIFSGNSLTVTFDTGELYMNSCTLEQAKHIALNDSLWGLEEVRVFLESNYSKRAEENKEANRIVNTVLQDDRYYYAEGSLYRVGIPLSIPKHLATDIANALTEIKFASFNYDDADGAYWSDELERLDNFWKWTSLIRTPESRNSFYSYCQENTLLITKQGFVVAFRRADHKGENPKLVKFVTQEYLRLRNNKKSTSVSVYKYDNSDYTLKEEIDGEKCTYVGTLKDLYSSLGEEEWFESVTTSNYTGLPAIYKIGQETRLPENECDFSGTECSEGLHFSSGGYAFSSYGDTPLAVVINPMDILNCPYSDHTKARTLALTPLCVLNNDCEFKLTPEIGTMIDEMFVNHVSNLESMLLNGNFKEFSKHSLVNELHFKSILNTVVTENKELVKDRYIKL